MAATQEQIDALSRIIAGSDHIVFFGGAGVSAASGIPSFRGAGGLYESETGGKYAPEVILSAGFFQTHTEEFFDFYRAKMLHPDAKPNACHRKLAELERRKKLKAVITQNVDGLHRAAGSERIFELHGNVNYNYCQKCGKFHPLSDILNSHGIPRCECGGVIKPDVVLYDEPLDRYTLEMATAFAECAEVLIIAGTSLTVYPASDMAYRYMGSRLVIINKTPTPADKDAYLVIHDDVSEVFAELNFK